MASEPIGVLDTVGAAVRFARVQAPAARGALLLAAIFGAVSIFGQYTGQGALASFYILEILATLMATGAMLRGGLSAAGGSDAAYRRGPAGLQWGAHEWRLAGAMVLMVLTLGCIVAVGVLIASIMLVSSGGINALGDLSPTTTPEQLMRLLGPRRVEGMALLYLAVTVVVAGTAVRLSLYAPATLAQQRIALFDSWRMTRGRFWGVLGVLILTLLPSFALFIFASGIESALAPGRGGTVAAPVAAVLALLSAAVGAFVQLPLSTGAAFSLYQRLSGSPRA